MPRIEFNHSGKAVEASSGDWIYDVSTDASGGIPFACKAGACGTCATEVLAGAGHLPPASAREVRTLEACGADPLRYRLPCLCDVPEGDLVFGTPLQARESEAKLGTHTVEVESYRPLNLTVCEVRFFMPASSFEFSPGQYMIFHVPGGDGTPVRRSYSISTPPSDRRHFEVCVRAVAGGRGSNYVHQLRPGDQLEVEGPFGDFRLQENSLRDILMIATGTGMAPIKSMLLHLLDQRSHRRVRLFFGVRGEGDLFYTDLLRGLAAHYPAFEYEIVLSRPSATGWAGRTGRVTDLIDALLQPGDVARTEVYLCGSSSMIEDCCGKLAAMGFDGAHLHHENFY